MTTITNFSLARMNNAYYVSFHQEIEKIITSAGETALGIQAADLTQYRDNLALLQDAVLRTLGSDKTAQLLSLDEQRDSYFRYVRNALGNLKFSSDPEQKALYEIANAKILKLYPASIANESNQEESAHISGFIVDVHKYFEPHLTKLGIKDMLNTLETVNDAFQVTFVERAEELSKIESGVTDQCRLEVDEAYNKMMLAINYYASRSDAADEPTMQIFINASSTIATINEVISSFQQSIRLAKSIKNAHKNKTEGENGSSSSSKPSSGSGTGTGGSELN